MLSAGSNPLTDLLRQNQFILQQQPGVAFLKEVRLYTGGGLTGGFMASEVKKADKNTCTCGHPFGKKESEARHKELTAKAVEDANIRAWDERWTNIKDRLDSLERKEHKHWWQ